MRPLSIYIHWPFCKSKCPYCDFNSHVRANVDDTIWRDGLLAEMRHYAQLLPDREVVSIFFGGGTPSLMQAQTVASLIDEATKLWSFAKAIEITLEANPTSIEAQKFKDFKGAGVNRVSIGVQSFNEKDLKFLGREHNADEAIQAIELAHKLFPRMSFDLIYALPQQSLTTWEKELEFALTLTKGHISLYQLTIEENTAFHYTYKNKGFELPEDTLAADMYLLTQSITETHHLPAYEISNHAFTGQESRHNLAYWRYDDYIGIGAGAHGRISLQNKRIATENIKSPERWLEQVNEKSRGIAVETAISSEEALEEALMMGLRLRGGIDFQDWQNRLGIDIQKMLSRKVLDNLTRHSLLISDVDHIQTTPQGRLVLNSILKELLS